MLKKTISFLGPIGSYSYFATIKYIKKNYQSFILKEHKNFKEIFYNLKNNLSNYAIIPLENNTSGFIEETYHLLCETNLYIIYEIILSIQHCLIAKKQNILKEIETIYSHPQSFKQCSQFLESLKHIQKKYTNSTSEAMKKIVIHNQQNIAAIGNIQNAKIYNLKIILKNIANKKNNSTRFVLLTNKKKQITDTNNLKTVLIISSNDIPYSQILLIFQQYNIQILKKKINISSNKNYQKTIYIELKINIKSQQMKHILYIFNIKKIFVHFSSCYEML